MVKEAGKPRTIPNYLIYEMDEGKPVYYRDYRDVLNGTKTFEQIMGSSIIQSLLVNLILTHLHQELSKDFVILINELGVQFAKKSWRNADIAIFEKKELLKIKIEDKYAQIPPKVVIEIDTKAALEDFPKPEAYFHRKTDQFLEFGVEKVIWIYTASEKFMIAESEKRWEMGNWDEDIEVFPNVFVNIRKLLDEFFEDDNP